MKRLFTLMVLLALTAGVVGCKSCRNWWRGTFLDPCPPADVCCDPYVPMVTPSAGCAPCMSGVPAATAVPGPGTYVPSN